MPPAIEPLTGKPIYETAPFSYGRAADTVTLLDADGAATPPQTITITVNKHPRDSKPTSQNEVAAFAVGAGDGGPASIPMYTGTGTVAYNVAAFTDGHGARAILADVTGDGVPDVIAGTGPGVNALVVVIDGATKQVIQSFTPFQDPFTGGLFLAAGDVDGDGIADVSVSADQTGGARVVVFDGRTGTRLADFFGIDDPAFRGGSRVAMGDVNADGLADLIVAAGTGGGPRIAVFDCATVRVGQPPTRLIGDFFAFEPTLRNGSFVTRGDLNGVGFDDLIFGGGPDGGPRVLAIDSRGLFADPPVRAVTLINYFANDSTLRSGVRVAAKDLDGDRLADLVTSTPTATGSDIEITYGIQVDVDGGEPSNFLDALFPELKTGEYVG